MFLEPNQTVLFVIDIQGKLAEIMADRDQVLQRTALVIQVADKLGIPIIVTEQAPDKLGPTIEAVQSVLSHSQRFSKLTFSCCGDPTIQDHLESLKRSQILITGIEAHVCVFQTVKDLLFQNYQTHVLADAVSSRTAQNRDIALERMRDEGAIITSSEMAVCELLKSASHSKFKEIMSVLK